jgi:hypothetical protein
MLCHLETRACPAEFHQPTTITSSSLSRNCTSTKVAPLITPRVVNHVLNLRFAVVSYTVYYLSNGILGFFGQTLFKIRSRSFSLAFNCGVAIVMVVPPFSEDSGKHHYMILDFSYMKNI